ncbi:MAG: iron-sulfur cluster assembly scaffold protein [Candidatus Micrarchaeota archaeon]|nr:iron-sulfur cluster assembly scaffold protein [Candidatus Micrarchaeota archaeon]
MDLYDEHYLAIYKNPYNYGKMEDADVKGGALKPSCGDQVEIYLKVKDGKIEKARFIGKGCVVSIVGTSLLMKEIEGKSIEEVKKWGPEKMYEITGMDLSSNPSREQCLMLGYRVLQDIFKKLSH